MSAPTLKNTPPGFYTQWNLERYCINRLAIYELLEVPRSELLHRTYSTLDCGRNQKYILYRGNLYEMRFMNEARHVFHTGESRGGESDPTFILSMRKCYLDTGEVRVALVQYKRM